MLENRGNDNLLGYWAFLNSTLSTISARNIGYIKPGSQYTELTGKKGPKSIKINKALIWQQPR